MARIIWHFKTTGIRSHWALNYFSIRKASIFELLQMSTIGINGPSVEMQFPLTDRQLSEWRFDFYGSPRNRLAQNVCTARNPVNACLRSAAELSTVLDGGKKWYEVSATGKATTGGPGWICTGLDLLRLEFVKNFPVPVDFEFSTGHLVFWHKLERCNYFLCTVSDLLQRCEPLDGRNFRHLMKHAIPDGGNWHMFVNLVRKHGVMPKSCYLASKPKSGTQLNKILRSKVGMLFLAMDLSHQINGNL